VTITDLFLDACGWVDAPPATTVAVASNRWDEVESR
jgi:hypothetical protein